MSITTETWWTREIVPASLAELGAQLRAHFGVPAVNFGTKGNARHRTGRHRSREWVERSDYCTNRAYGTRDPRDRRGNGRHIRAFDLTLPLAELVRVCHRIDAAVRAGQLPSVAEWFGTFDGRTVVGWYEGHPGDADDSHLAHLHVGFWTEAAGADHTHLFAVMTGEDMPTSKEVATAVWTTEAREYVDEKHDGVRDQRSVLDILFATHAAALAAADPIAIAREVIAQLPDDTEITDEQLERVLRRVFGSLDSAPAAPDVP